MSRRIKSQTKLQTQVFKFRAANIELIDKGNFHLCIKDIHTPKGCRQEHGPYLTKKSTL